MLNNTLNEVLYNLNLVQNEAVTHTDGPLLVLAGAGSGKTRILTHRIAYLIKEKGVSPFEILAITFTNKAANEMKERVAQLVGGVSRTMWVSTFHSTCVRILRQEAERLGYSRNFVIYDANDSNRLVTYCLRDLNIDSKRYPPRKIAAAISNAKNELLDAETFAMRATTYAERMVADVYKLYQERLYQSNALDFDDLIMITVNLFQLFPSVLDAYQDKFKYILVDEYQDTNLAQYELVRIWAGKHRNLCVVGDDDQCLPAGTLVSTDKGDLPIEKIKKGQDVLTAVGRGGVSISKVTNVFKKTKTARHITFITKSGARVTATDNHKMFALVPQKSNREHHYVYLMHRQELGWRIGVTNDLVTRLRLERSADKILAVKSCKSDAEARYWETYYSLFYGIPTSCFKERGGLTISGEVQKELYRRLDVDSRIERLTSDLGINPDYHAFCLGAVKRGSKTRLKVKLGFCHRVHAPESKGLLKNPRILHSLSLETSDEETFREIEDLGYELEEAKKGKRLRITSTDIKRLEEIAHAIAEKTGAIPEFNFRLGIFNQYSLPALIMPASNIKEGFWLPVLRDNQIFYDEVVETREEIKNEPVYDLEIDRTHNFIANGVVVHNSIYKFRGADIRNILEFERDYPECCVIKLEQNYRSTKTILKAANYVMQNNRARKPKALWTENDDGELITRYQGENEHEEATFVANEIEKMIKTGRQYKEFAVFYRTNAQSRVLEEIFLRYGVPYKIIGGLKFYDRAEIKDVLAYLRVLSNPRDTVSLKRIINVPKRGLGDTTIAKVDEHALKNNVSFYDAIRSVDDIGQLSTAAQKNIKKFLAIIDKLQGIKEKETLENLTKALLDETGYLAVYETEGTMEAENRAENVKEFIGVIKEFEDSRESCELDDFLEEVSLIADIDNLDDENNAVTLMTVHNAKGLEFNVVFIVGMEDGIFPHIRSMTDTTELEEERRLFYVGITRAMQKLYLCNAWSRNLWGGVNYNSMSRFLHEVPPELLQNAEQIDVKAKPPSEIGAFAIGDNVYHKKFGEGRVVSVKSADQVTVFFESEGERTLLLNYAPLEKR